MQVNVTSFLEKRLGEGGKVGWEVREGRGGIRAEAFIRICTVCFLASALIAIYYLTKYKLFHLNGICNESRERSDQYAILR